MKAKQKKSQSSNAFSLTNKYLSLRTPVIFILSLLMLLFIAGQAFLFSFILSTLTAFISFLVSSFLSGSIDRVWADRLAYRNKRISHETYKPVSTIRDNFIYFVDYGMTMTFPFIACYLAFKYPSIKATIETVFYSSQLWIFFWILAFLYTGLLFFIYRKKIFVAYTILWISVPLVAGLAYFGDVLGIRENIRNGFNLYSALMAIYLGFVSAIDYFDKEIQKKEGKAKKAWNKLIDFISWDFLSEFKPPKA